MTCLLGLCYLAGELPFSTNLATDNITQMYMCVYSCIFKIVSGIGDDDGVKCVCMAA